MKIAIIGSRGFLTQHGGFETFVKEIALRLVTNGYCVTVYGLNRYRDEARDDTFPDVSRVWLPTLKVKFLEKVVASYLAIIHATFSANDVILALGVSGGLLLWLPRLFGKRIFVNPDGIEWQRPKWSAFVSFFLRVSEAYAITFGHRVVADSKRIAGYIIDRYSKHPAFIPYGAAFNHSQNRADASILRNFGLVRKRYFLQLCRLEPENNPHIVLREFLQYKGDKMMVVIGDTPHSTAYKAQLMRDGDGRVKFLGGIYGEVKDVLLRNAYCYIHGHEVGGTNPALLEAMASAVCPVVLNVPYNLEVIQNCGVSFSRNSGDLAAKLDALDCDSTLVRVLGQKALQRVRAAYTWKQVISNYEGIITELSNEHRYPCCRASV